MKKSEKVKKFKGEKAINLYNDKPFLNKSFQIPEKKNRGNN